MSHKNRPASYKSHNVALPSSKKTHSERNKQILAQLLKEDANKKCADCKTAAFPRWASWSIGCFICIRCSGIHRSMGTHISKVKSVDLDSWTDEQVENMVKWGNDKCKVFWEDKLPENYIPDPSKLDNFIRTKYEMKKWTASTSIPNPLTLKKTKPHASLPESTPLEVHQNHLSHHTIKNRSVRSNSALSDDFGEFESSTSMLPINNSTSTSPIKAESISKPLTSPSSSEGSISTDSNKIEVMSNSRRPDLKKSILSLYSSPSPSASSFAQNSRRQQQFSTSAAQRVSTDSLSKSLSDLSFNSNSNNVDAMKSSLNFSDPKISSTSTAAHMGKSDITQMSNIEWSKFNGSNSDLNPWNSSYNSPNYNSSMSNTVKNLDLEDDLFKNVWAT